MSDRKTLPSYKDIIDYWMPVINKSSEYTASSIDWGEPTCWACGEFWNGKYDTKEVIDLDTPDGMKKVYSLWKNSPLERCHIVPDSCGGSPDPSNIFLLCLECHALSPDTTNRELFFKWCKSQSWYKRLEFTVAETFRSFGFDIYNQSDAEQCLKLMEPLTNKNKEFKEYYGNNAARHFGGTSLATFFAACLSFADNKTNNFMNQKDIGLNVLIPWEEINI